MSSSKSVELDSLHPSDCVLQSRALTVLLFGRAETAQEMTSWMMMLGTQIKLYKPKPTVRQRSALAEMAMLTMLAVLW